MKKILIPILAGLLSACSIIKLPNTAQDATVRNIGIHASYPGGPVLSAGFSSVSYHLTPVGTNQLYSARRFDAIAASHTGNPISLGVEESFAAGDVAVSTNATGQAIIPKSPAVPNLPAVILRPPNAPMR